MAGWKGEEDTVENQVSTFNTFTLIVTNLRQIPAIARFYRTVYGDEEDAMENPTTTVITDYQAGVEPVNHRQVQKNPF